MQLIPDYDPCNQPFYWIYYNVQLSNPTSCDAKFIICSMVDFVNGNLGTSNMGHTCRSCKASAYTLTYSDDGTNCSWACSGPEDEYGGDPRPNFHLGCKEVTVTAGTTVNEFTGMYALTGSGLSDPSKCWIDYPTEYCPITYSPDPNDQSNAFKLTDAYVDFLLDQNPSDPSKNCPLDMTACSGIVGPWSDTEPSGTPAVSTCAGQYSNNWDLHASVIKRGNDGNPITASYCPVGNWVTMSMMYMGNYYAVLKGTLTGAPTGTTFKIIYPKDTTATDTSAILYDSTAYTVSGSSCNGNTLSVNTPFVIPMSMSGRMIFKMQLPNNSCGNSIPNGEKINFIGSVYANKTHSPYDSGAYMYGITLPYFRDTTAPVIDSLTAVRISGNRVKFTLVAHEDTSLLTGTVGMASDSLGDTTCAHYYDNSPSKDVLWIDTVNMPHDTSAVHIKVTIFNEMGLSTTATVNLSALLANDAIKNSYAFKQ